MITRLQRIVAWLRTGYPHGIPERHYLPLVALLGRRLSDDETRELGERLVAGGAPSLHFYTLNLAKPTNAVLERLSRG